MTIVLILAAALVAGVAGYAWGWLTGKSHAEHPEGPEACRDRLTSAEQAARRWRDHALRLEARLQQIDHDVTISTEILLSEIDRAIAGECEHGLKSGCDWCDARPVPYVLVDQAAMVGG